MNIFVVSNDQTECARMLDDKRVVKMTLETAQLLSTAANMCGFSTTYRKNHINHPCSIWARTSKANYLWLLDLFHALLNEYEFRYNKIHSCARLLNELNEGVKAIPDGSLTQFANCSLYKDLPVFDAYKKTMTHKWVNDKRVPQWKHRERPDWSITNE